MNVVRPAASSVLTVVPLCLSLNSRSRMLSVFFMSYAYIIPHCRPRAANLSVCAWSFHLAVCFYPIPALHFAEHRYLLSESFHAASLTLSFRALARKFKAPINPDGQIWYDIHVLNFCAFAQNFKAGESE